MNYHSGIMPASDNPLRAADVRERNEKIVLKLIRAAGPRGLSQSEAVVATGLRAPTIFRIFTSLEESGYIEPRSGGCSERGTADRERKGRPRVSYVVRAEALYSFGVEFWVDRVSLGLFDFSGSRVDSCIEPLPRGADAEAVLATIAGLVERCVAAHGLDPARLLGLGLGAPGQVNVRSREVAFYSRIPGMRDFPMASRLEGLLGMPILIHNNCSVIALAEYRYGGLAAEGSAFTFLLRSGVNGAFVDGGRVYLASDGSTIESGHVAVDSGGEACACGSHGCLEAYVTALDRPNLEAGRWLFEGLEPELAAGNPSALVTLDEASRYLAAASRTVARLFRPRAFLVVAASLPVAETLVRLLRDRFARDASGFDRPPPSFYARAYDESLAQRGAADLVIDDFLE